MLKRLTTIAFVFGLIFAFGASAFADKPFPDRRARTTGTTPEGVAVFPHNSQIQPRVTPNHDWSGSIDEGQLLSLPIPNAPDTETCYFNTWVDFDNWGADEVDYQINGGDPEKVGMRWDLNEFTYADLYGGYVYLVGLHTEDTAVDMVVEVWDDDGGLPGNMLYSEHFLTASTGYNPIYFASPVAIYNTSFYIVIGVDGAEDPNDYIVILSDDAGLDPSHPSNTTGNPGTATVTSRGVWYDGTDWMSLYDAEGGLADPNVLIYAEWCENFSDCRQEVPYSGSSNVPLLPSRADETVCGVGPWADGGNLVGVGQRYSFSNDTLKAVTVRHYDLSYIWWDPLTYYDSNSTNGFLVQVWQDDGTGEIDEVAGPLASETVPGGLDNIYPSGANQGVGEIVQNVVVDFSSHNLILRGAYHFTLTMTDTSAAAGQIAGRVSAIGNGFTGGSVWFQDPDHGWERTGPSVNWSAATGECPFEEQAFDIRPTVCLDEFANCQNYLCYGGPATYGWTMDGPPGTCALAHPIKGLQVNRVEKIRFQVGDDSFWGDPAGLNGTPDLRLAIYANVLGAPGAAIWDTLISDPNLWPGWNEVVIPDGGVQVLGDFFVGYENASADPANNYFYGLVDDATGPKNGGAWLKYDFNDGDGCLWYDLDVVFEYPDNLEAEVEFCSIPVLDWPCSPGDDWTTVNHDYARTGHSGDAIGDAFCDLNFNWRYTHPAYTAITNGPIIWNNYVVQAFSTGTLGGYFIFDLPTGGLVDSITINDYGTVIGGNLRCQPTIDMVDYDVDGQGTIESRPLLFVAGGVANAIGAFDMSYLPDSVHMVWAVTPSNGWLGHTGFMSSVRYCAFIVLDGILYWGDDGGYVYAADAATGLPFSGWDDGGGYMPVALDGNVLRSGATDGGQLFYSVFASGTEGDVAAIDAATGALNWTLATGPDGLQAPVLYGVDEYIPGTENFQSGVTYDGQYAQLFANSVSFSANVSNTYEAVFYRINTADGGVNSAVFSQRMGQSTPILDAARVILLTAYGWSYDGGVLGGAVLAFDRITGLLDWASSPPGTTETPWGRWINFEGVMSCEPDGAPDILMGFSGGTNGNLAYLSFFNGDNGSEIFHRRIDYGAGNNLGQSGAMGVDDGGAVHVIFADATGTITDLTKGDDRPRLEIMDWHPTQAVPFGTGDTVVTFPAVYTNTGCADLVITMVADTLKNNSTPGGSPGVVVVRQGFSEFGAGLADQMTTRSKLMHKFGIEIADNSFEDTDWSTFGDTRSREYVNAAAMVVPDFLIENGTYPGDVFSQSPYPGDAGGGGFVLAPLDTAAVHVHVHGALVNRGRQGFYVEFQHNDPDYFLNDTGMAPTRWPDVPFTLVGGCLSEYTVFPFGEAGENFQIIYNMGRLGTSDTYTDEGANFYVASLDAGEVVDMNFAAMFMYGAVDDSSVTSSGDPGEVFSRRIATNNQWWYSGSTENNAWISLQGDPDWADSVCTPLIQTGTIAMVWDGSTYQPMDGNLSPTQYIDSVQNFLIDDVWDWSYGGGDIALAPFDNDITMGLQTQVMHVGPVDAQNFGLDLLNNGMLFLMETEERNGGTVDGWYFGAFYDHDINLDSPEGGYDTVGYDASVSAAWVYDGGDPAAELQMCQVKIPFGCGYDPLINTLILERGQSVLSNSAATAWDSAYFWMTLPQGITHGQDPATADDQDAWYTYLGHDFTAYDTIRYAVAIGGFDGVTDLTSADEKIAPFAHLMNKLAGFGRGDVDNDNVISFADIIYLSEYVNNSGPGPVPFQHLGDVDNSGGMPTQADVVYLFDYYFNYGPCPLGDFIVSMDPADYQ
jgi:hypothetical protein